MINKFSALLSLLLFTPALLSAQDDAARHQVVPLRDGGFVAFKSESARIDKSRATEMVPTVQGGLRSQALVTDDQVIHRVLQNPRGEYIFGYDLVVQADADSKKFTITVKPLDTALENKLAGSRIPTLREGAQPQVVDDGDSFALDLLVNQNAGVKIVDVVKVSFERSKLWDDGAAPMPRDFTLDAVALRVVNFKLSIGGRQVMTGIPGAKFAGALLWCYVEGHGRFILSLVPRDGYPFEKTGIISDNKIEFRAHGRQYEWFSSESILPGGGSWNVWVLHDPTYRPFGTRESRPKEPNKLEKIDQAIKSLPKKINPTATFGTNKEKKKEPPDNRFKLMAGAADRIENLWPKSP